MSESAVRRGKPARDWRERFLESYAETGNIGHACRAAGVSRATFYRERARNPEFDELALDAIDEAIDRLELEARRRAAEGVKRERWQRTGTDARGRPIYERQTIREYSDTLLIFLLKAGRPEKYRESYDLKAIVAEAASQAPSEPIDRTESAK